MATELSKDGKEYHQGVLVDKYAANIKAFELESRDAISMSFDGQVSFLITARVGPDSYSLNRGSGTFKRRISFDVSDVRVLTREEAVFMCGAMRVEIEGFTKGIVDDGKSSPSTTIADEDAESLVEVVSLPEDTKPPENIESKLIKVEL